MPFAARLVLVSSLLVAGCRHYLVPEASLDAYASLSRHERRIALVPAQRRDGGATVYVRATDARPLAGVHDGKREVRVAPRARTTVGIVLLVEGLGLFAGGVAMALAGRNDMCSNDVCGGPIDAAIGGTIAGFGGVELLTGIGLIASGSAHVEIAPGDRRFVYLP